MPPAMRCAHHPLESLSVVGGAVAVQGSDTARQDALNCAYVCQIKLKLQYIAFCPERFENAIFTQCIFKVIQLDHFVFTHALPSNRMVLLGRIILPWLFSYAMRDK